MDILTTIGESLIYITICGAIAMVLSIIFEIAERHHDKKSKRIERREEE